MPSESPVLIVGGGPAGLVMALFLAKNGILSRVIDKATEFHTGSRGFGIQPRTFELMKVLGILDDVQKLATPIPTMRAYKLPGGTVPVKTWDLYEKTGVVWPDRPYANGGCLSQDALEGVIRRHLAGFGIEVERGMELVALEQTGEGVVAAIRDHSTGETRETSVEYLVGADGARGPTHKLLGLSFEGETKDTDGMVWGDVEIQGLGSDYWHIWGKPGHFTIMARPISPDGNKFGVGITGLNFDPRDLADEGKAKEFIREQTGRADLEFGDFSWLSYFRPNMRMVNKFGEGRAFLVGDAAHVHSPTGGQGMNTSLQDSTNLAWKLALVLKNLASPSLLSSFDEERLPVIVQMLHATSALYTHAVLEVDKETKPEEDDKSASGWFRWRNSALEMYGVNYRYSPIVVEERAALPREDQNELMKAHAYQGYEGKGSLCAGDRAPEAPGLVQSDGVETSLFALFKPDVHSVIVFARDAQTSLLGGIYDAVAAYAVQSVVQTLTICHKDAVGRDKYLVDRDGHAFSAYLIDEDVVTIVVVRPDGFIGAIVREGEGVVRYFKKIFTALG
ncbi:FAD binding domain-containing protein [Mycena rebaudengoi]|nr:FAD binding domain-containing protein [Mycena rebaudengoi]